MKSKLINVFDIDKLIGEIDKNIKEGINPSFAIIYISSIYDVRLLVSKLNKYDFIVLGSTTAGEVFADDNLGVGELEDSITCMLVETNPDALAFKTISVDGDDYSRVGKQVGRWAKNRFKDVSIITATSGLSFDNDAYTQGIISEDIEYVFGGSAGDDLKLTETFVFSKDNFSNKGILALAIDRDKIDIIGARGFGWIGIGKEKIVTKAEGNIVYEIDNKPAVEFYAKYLDIEHIDIADIPITGLEYPLEVTMRDNQIVYRAVLGVDKKYGALVFAGHVKEKSKVRIAAPQGKSIINYVKESIDKVQKDNNDFQADLALVFPCISRKSSLGTWAKDEIKIAYETIKAPIIGAYVYGEIGAFPGGYCFHNETFVTALLKEKE